MFAGTPLRFPYHPRTRAGVAEWQTQGTQNPPLFTGMWVRLPPPAPPRCHGSRIPRKTVLFGVALAGQDREENQLLFRGSPARRTAPGGLSRSRCANFFSRSALSLEKEASPRASREGRAGASGESGVRSVCGGGAAADGAEAGRGAGTTASADAGTAESSRNGTFSAGSEASGSVETTGSGGRGAAGGAEGG